MHVSTSRTPYARLQALPLGEALLTDGFWAHKQTVNRRVSLRRGYQKLKEFGNLHNLRLAAGLSREPYRGPLFMDSDLYKWLEAVAYDQAISPDRGLVELADGVIDLLAAAQAEDGYLDSYWQVVRPDERWTDLDHGHELYCAGHLIEAAVAFHRATRGSKLLQIARRFADCIDGVFGPGKREGTPGHPEIELALVELYRETGEQQYLDLAGFFVDQRGQQTLGLGGRFFGPEYHQDRVPVRDASVVEGHAVRQLYLAAGVSDLYLETGEPALMEAMERLWQDMTARKMHLTGGFGARFTGEAFGDPYELPSDRCYCETCAAIAAMMWNWRMLLVTGDARYADLLERSLYNGFLSGVSLDGERYFYVNPLQSRGGIERPEWYSCACCPPNIMRQIALVGHYVATTDGAGIQIHQYAPSLVSGESGGDRVTLRLKTCYPRDGDVSVTIDKTPDRPWRLSLRIPAWCRAGTVNVNGQGARATAGGRYAHIERCWQAGDVVRLSLPMAPTLIEANPRIDAIRGSLAIERGPLVYCLEQADQEPGIDLLDVRVDRHAQMRVGGQDDILGGVVAIEVEGATVDTAHWDSQLYRTVSTGFEQDLPRRRLTLTAIPYYAWANRGPGAMRVWIPALA
jgi:DUF1680 family protein